MDCIGSEDSWSVGSCVCVHAMLNRTKGNAGGVREVEGVKGGLALFFGAVWFYRVATISLMRTTTYLSPRRFISREVFSLKRTSSPTLMP